MSKEEPDKLVAARKGSPLILGLGEHGMILASDANAIVEHTRNVVYIEDGEVIEVRRNSFKTYDLNRKIIQKEVEAIDWDIATIEKSGFDHYMMKEIHEQQQTIVDAFRGRIVPEFGNVRLDGLRLTDDEIFNIQRIIFIACGTSYHAGDRRVSP